MVEWAALEMRYIRKGIGGSNPPASAMDKVAGILAAILMGSVGIRYSYLIFKNRIHPVFTTWLLFSVAVILSLTTYLYSSQHSLIGNIINVMDVAMCLAILLSLFLVDRSISFRFSRFEAYCLFATGIIIIFWIFTEEHFISNLLLQAIIVIAYIPTLMRLRNTDIHKESYGMWITIWIATLFGFFAALIRSDLVGVIYSLRGLLLIILVLIFMYRIDRPKIKINNHI